MRSVAVLLIMMLLDAVLPTTALSPLVAKTILMMIFSREEEIKVLLDQESYAPGVLDLYFRQSRVRNEISKEKSQVRSVEGGI